MNSPAFAKIGNRFLNLGLITRAIFTEAVPDASARDKIASPAARAAVPADSIARGAEAKLEVFFINTTSPERFDGNEAKELKELLEQHSLRPNKT